MKVYVDDSNDTINILQSVASASTMISSVAAETKEYILSKFPNNFFKHVYIDTSETVVQQNINNKYNTTANKIPYPSMGITPEISLDDPIGGMQKTMHLSTPNLYLRKDIRRSYNRIIVDPDAKYGIYYTSDYITTNFNFKIVTNSYIQNVDTAFFLKSKFQKDFFQFLNNRHVQVEIPKSFIRAVADLNKWDLDNEEDLEKLRLYLIGTSLTKDSVKKRLNLATGKQCFFVNEKTNFLTMFADLDAPPSINRDAQVEGEYVITFRFQVSCWLPNAFIMSINKDTLKKLHKSTVKSLESDTDQQDSGFSSVCVSYNSEILGKKDTIYFTDSEGNKQIGVLSFYETFMYDTNREIPEILLMNRMKPEFKRIHAYAKDVLNIDLKTLIMPIFRNSSGLIPESQYTFDYENMKAKINSKFNSDVVLAIYINRTLYESVRKAMTEDKNYFRSNILTNIFITIGNEQLKVKVKSFVNNSEQSKQDILKSLRVQTPYGIGYISLIEDNSEDGYKICLGNDANNNPIIKKFETV